LGFKNTLLTMISIALIAGCGKDYPEMELSVTYRLVEGSCLYDDKWEKVSGKILDWQIDRGPKSSFIGHSYQFLDAPKASKELGRPELRFFKIESPFRESLDFLDKRKQDLKDDDLELAMLVYEVSEATLFYLNKVINPKLFQQPGDAEVLIPGPLTVCKLKSEYLMKNSKSRFTKSLFGGVKMISDETVMVGSDKDTFAQKLLKTIY
jgi:hypothetical protein